MPQEFPPTLEGLLELCAHLRGPGGCPWDGEQTHESLKPMLLEETYELIDAIDGGKAEEIAEEVGDVLYHLVYQIRIADEAGDFNAEDVAGGVRDKLMRRHPHVFGDATVKDSGEVAARWDDIKRAEPSNKDKGTLDGIPRAMPSLSYAQALGNRASKVGFEWDDFGGVLDKVREELDELQQAETQQEREAEYGDVLFTLVNVARWLKVDAEDSLRATGHKFRARFSHMEQLARERGQSVSDLSFDEKEALWVEAKRVVG